jgi:type I site-specific restriction-modification system R (restriction) subunit
MMKTNGKQGHNWDWLADPDAALELYSIERKAFHEWQTAELEWSEVTRDLDTEHREKMTKEQRELVTSLQDRLDRAAEAYYEEARQRLHQA